MKTLAIALTLLVVTVNESIANKTFSTSENDCLVTINDSLLTSEMVIDNDTYIFEGIRPVNVMPANALLLDRNTNLHAVPFVLKSSVDIFITEKERLKTALSEVGK